MAREDGGPALNLKLDLLKEGSAYSFMQVMRLLRCLDRTGKNATVRLRPKLSLAFPASDVEKIEENRDGGEGFEVTANFMGLYGSSSPLPAFYTEELLDEEQEDDEGRSVSRDFTDLIHHRLLSLLFACWMKYRQHLQAVEEDDGGQMERLFSLMGLGESALRKEIPDPQRLLRYIGLFTQFPRSALGLKTLLRDFLGGVLLEVIPCMVRKAAIPPDQQWRLGAPGTSLGANLYLGEETDDRMNKFRIRTGPLNRENYLNLLPGGKGHEGILFITRLYLTEPLEYDLELVLAEGQGRPLCLGGEQWSRLGLDTWIFSGDALEESRIIYSPQS